MLIISKDNLLEKNLTCLTFESLIRYLENNYILGLGENLKPTVFRFNPELISFFSLKGEGTSNIEKFMKVHLEKITLKEVRKLLSELYNKYFKYQNIEIEINS